MDFNPPFSFEPLGMYISDMSMILFAVQQILHDPDWFNVLSK